MTYWSRKLALAPLGRCLYPGCAAAACEDALLCASHRAESAARKRRSARAVRSLRRAAGLCAVCAAPSACYRCAVCRPQRARLVAAAQVLDQVVGEVVLDPLPERHVRDPDESSRAAARPCGA